MHHSARTKSSLITGIALSLVVPAACRPAEQQNAANAVAAPANAVETAEPVLPVPEPPIDREALLIAALKAAIAAATGSDDREEQAVLHGKRFVFRTRFGCAGAPGSDAMRAEYREGDQTLRFEVTPSLAPDVPLAKAFIDQGYEAAIGFVIEQPWLLTPSCAAAAPEDAAAGSRLAIAQLFTADDARTNRPPEAYKATERLEAEQPPAEGFDFVLSGRMEPLSDGRAIRCIPAAGKPACLISVTIDRAAIHEARSGDLIAEWRS